MFGPQKTQIGLKPWTSKISQIDLSTCYFLKLSIINFLLSKWKLLRWPDLDLGQIALICMAWLAPYWWQRLIIFGLGRLMFKPLNVQFASKDNDCLMQPVHSQVQLPNFCTSVPKSLDSKLAVLYSKLDMWHPYKHWWG